jgi:hypothetical protein
MKLYPTKQEYDQVRLDNLVEVIDLNLANKNITSLKKGDFDGFPNLRYLQLGENQLSSLPD